MGKLFSALKPQHHEFIAKQKMFFVATTGNNTKINLSPKGLKTLRVIDDNNLVWLNLTGSGNETAAHLLEDNRMTIMFCSFDEKPLILRLYGYAKILTVKDNKKLYDMFDKFVGTRQLLTMKIESVHSSCGFGVPKYKFIEQRQLLIDWSNKKGKNGIKKYQQDNNMISLDNKPTGLKF